MSQDANDSQPPPRQRRPAPKTASSRRTLLPDLSESYFQRFAESSEEVLWLADLHAKTLLYVSPRFEQLWGVRADVLLRDPTRWNRAVLASDAKQLPMPFFAEDPRGEETVREYRITSRHGETRWIRDRRFHLRDGDGVTMHVGGIAEDITEGKEREMERENLLQREREARTAAEAVVAAKDEFLAVVTHELRSPLNAIRGWSHVLRQATTLTPIQIRALDAIDRNTQAQARLVDDLLDSQRILCGELEVSLARVPLAELIDQAAATVQPVAQAKRIRLEVAHDAAIGLVQADPNRLRQAFVKLLSNAVKFTPEDGIVTVRSGVREHALAIEVQDTGIGLEPAQLPFVFDRFAQADSSSTRRANGLGLGLSLAQQLVELHGGRIVVESEGVGLGARFTVELPLHLGLASSADGNASGTAGSSLAGKRVVIVEDDNDGREVLGIILRGAQMELRSFDRAASAYEYLAQAPADQQPDAMISDIAMPDEDGYAFIRRVREMEDHRHRPHLVALALTSFTRAEDRLRALKAGFDAHVPKPIDPETVLSSLERALGLSKEAGLPA